MKSFWISIFSILYLVSAHLQTAHGYLGKSFRDLDERSLSNLEIKLYQGRDFSEDSISLRIERLEIALFGEISKDLDLSSRLIKLEEQIALMELNARKQNLKQSYPEEAEIERERNAEARRLRDRVYREERDKKEMRQRRYQSVSPFIRSALYRFINSY